MLARDKQMHVLAGFAAGIIPAIAVPIAGGVVAMIVGFVKEAKDHESGTGTVDGWDIVATITGGLVATVWAAAGPGLAALLLGVLL